MTRLALLFLLTLPAITFAQDDEVAQLREELARLREQKQQERQRLEQELAQIREMRNRTQDELLTQARDFDRAKREMQEQIVALQAQLGQGGGDDDPLAQEVELEAKNRKLQDALEDLASSGVLIEIDEGAAERVKKAKLTLILPKIPLRHALSIILANAKVRGEPLTWEADDGRVTIR